MRYRRLSRLGCHARNPLYHTTKKELEKIDKQIPGISWGFSSEPKPWTAEEQKEAVQGTDKAIRDRELLTR